MCGAIVAYLSISLSIFIREPKLNQYGAYTPISISLSIFIREPKHFWQFAKVVGGISLSIFIREPKPLHLVECRRF